MPTIFVKESLKHVPKHGLSYSMADLDVIDNISIKLRDAKIEDPTLDEMVDTLPDSGDTIVLKGKNLYIGHNCYFYPEVAKEISRVKRETDEESDEEE